MPISAFLCRTASAQSVGVVNSRSYLPCCSPRNIPQISGTVLRYFTTDTFGVDIGRVELPAHGILTQGGALSTKAAFLQAFGCALS